MMATSCGFESHHRHQPVLMKKMQEKKPHFCVAFSHILQQNKPKLKKRVKFSKNRERDSKITFPEMQKHLFGRWRDSNSFSPLKKKKQLSNAACVLHREIGRTQAAFFRSWRCLDWYFCLHCAGFFGGLGHSYFSGLQLYLPHDQRKGAAQCQKQKTSAHRFLRTSTLK